MQTRLIRSLGVFLVLILTVVPQLAAQAQGITPDRFLPGDTTISPAAGEQSSPAIAQGGNTVLVVWNDGRANTTDTSGLETADDIYGMRFDRCWRPSRRRPLSHRHGASQPGQASDRLERQQLAGDVRKLFDQRHGRLLREVAGLRARQPGRPGAGSAAGTDLQRRYRSTNQWAVANNGDTWVLAFWGTAASGDLTAIRISPDGVVLDPPTRSLVPATYYMRFNLQLACAAGTCLATFNESACHRRRAFRQQPQCAGRRAVYFIARPRG